MSITATFFTHSKKLNSMKLPTGGTNISIVIKDPSSVLNPTLILDRSNPTAFNYVRIPTFNRYYWITDWISDHGMWIANCKVDVLTSWRAEILDSYQYVTRNQAYYDLEVPDGRYPMIDGVEFDSVDFGNNSPFLTDLTHNPWITILAVVNSYGIKINGLVYYLMGANDAGSLMNNLLEPAMTPYGSFDIGKETMMALLNPTQYITKSFAVPYDIRSHFTELPSASSINVGWWDIPGSYSNTKMAVGEAGYRWFEIWNYTFNLPTRSVEEQPLGTWASKLPFTEYKLFAGPFGQIVIDTGRMNLGLGQALTARIKADLHGNAILTLEEADGNIIFRTSTNVAVDMTLSSLAINWMDTAGNMMGVVGSLGGLGNAIQEGGASNIATAGNKTTALASSAAKSLFPSPQIVGGTTGAIAAISEPWRLQATFHKIAAEDREHFGRPLCQRLQLSDPMLSGYTECADAHVEIPATDSEISEIESFLANGFYKEN